MVRAVWLGEQLDQRMVVFVVFRNGGELAGPLGRLPDGWRPQPEFAAARWLRAEAASKVGDKAVHAPLGTPPADALPEYGRCRAVDMLADLPAAARDRVALVVVWPSTQAPLALEGDTPGTLTAAERAVVQAAGRFAAIWYGPDDTAREDEAGQFAPLPRRPGRMAGRPPVWPANLNTTPDHLKVRLTEALTVGVAR